MRRVAPDATLNGVVPVTPLSDVAVNDPMSNVPDCTWRLPAPLLPSSMLTFCANATVTPLLGLITRLRNCGVAVPPIVCVPLVPMNRVTPSVVEEKVALSVRFPAIWRMAPVDPVPLTARVPPETRTFPLTVSVPPVRVRVELFTVSAAMVVVPVEYVGALVPVWITTLSIDCGTTFAQPDQLVAVAHAVLVVPAHVHVCAPVSMTIALLAPSEPAAPGDASVSVAALVAASWMVPPLRASALTDV